MAGQDLQRREILRIMALAAAAAPFPGFSRWSFALGHESRGMEQIRPANYKPQFFSDGEYAVVERLTELIIPTDQTPGAKEAGVAEFIDFMISRDREQQYPFRTGLSWLNAHSERLLGKPFLGLSDKEQISILEPLAYKAKYREGEEDGREFFRRMKEMTIMGFYTTEIGYKELDNPALKFYAESPACPHKDDPEHKHLPPPKW
ncbi:MAG TPA: gluconate 2-dehydrogenase subunit 3 family protein [Terriglobales bacterium]|jgi:gluconate 2-dehydrogenase gamma chain|nr:gluconate 2-dehydrogenase subunit 3 family protein [Terriglobales bacterium]